MTDTKPTYPAAFDEEVETVEQIPSPPPDEHLACDWGNAEACQDDNTLRAEFAGLAVKAYAQRVAPGGGEDPETVIGDLFSDLRHLCDALDLDYDYLASRDLHYVAELHGEF